MIKHGVRKLSQYVWLSAIRSRVVRLPAQDSLVLDILPRPDPCKFATSLLLQPHVRYPPEIPFRPLLSGTVKRGIELIMFFFVDSALPF
jgi:hypothetical protein